MKNKIIIIIGILLFVGGVSLADVFTNYAQIVGEAKNVISPTFYLGSPNNETLLVNEKPPTCSTFTIEGIYRTFKTKDLGGINFGYSPQFKFSVRAEIATTTSPATSSTSTIITPSYLIVNFGYYDAGGEPIVLSSQNIELDNSFKEKTLEGSPNSKEPKGVKGFFYEFEKSCTSCVYTISNCSDDGFYTKTEMTK